MKQVQAYLCRDKTKGNQEICLNFGTTAKPVRVFIPVTSYKARQLRKLLD